MCESVVEVNFRFSRGLFYDGGVYIYGYRYIIFIVITFAVLMELGLARGD